MTFFFHQSFKPGKCSCHIEHLWSCAVSSSLSKMCIVVARWLARVFRKPVCINVEGKKRRCKNLQFNSDWTEKYKYIETAKDEPMCLLCNQYTSAAKDYNLQRHF